MAQDTEHGEAAARTMVVDLVVAAIIFAFGALVVFASYQLGARWQEDGPQSGYFPFYVGLLICISGGVVLVQSLVKIKSDRAVFASIPQFKQVLIILIPSTFFVLGVQLIGIYVSAAAFIGLFMKFVGRYTWLRAAAVSIAVSVSSFVLFEVWFQIPLPKGPVEAFIGY